MSHVYTISRMEEYMIPYLKDAYLIRSELTAAFESYDCGSGSEVIRIIVIRLIQVGDCWISV